MEIDTNKIIAQEYNWVYQNEPTFSITGNSLTGRVGRDPDGNPINVVIIIPEYYPVVKPIVKIPSDIQHPNIEADKTLALQLLDEWEPNYRLKDIIAATRRLFIKSKKSIKTRVQRPIQTAVKGDFKNDQLEGQIKQLQSEIQAYNREITQIKSQQLANAGVKAYGIGAYSISSELEMKCEIMAIQDLLELLEIKFEEADIDQTDFFRLYRNYVRDQYILKQQINVKEKNEKNELSTKTQTKEPIAN